MLALMRSAIGAAGSEGGSMCVADRHAQLAAMLERERSRDGAADVPSVERAADALLGPLYYRAIFTDRAGARSRGRASSSAPCSADRVQRFPQGAGSGR